MTLCFIIGSLYPRQEQNAHMYQAQADQYSQLLNEKVDHVTQLFSSFTLPQVDVFASEPMHFRQRAEFRVWHEGDCCFHAMFEPGKKTDPIEITHFDIASESICELMPKVMAQINNNPELKHKLFQIEYLATLSGEMLVTLIYHKPIAEQWIEQARILKESLGIQIIGRARKIRILLDQDYVIETLTVDDKKLHYKQVEGSFTQPNARMNEKMLSWARSCTQDSQHDLLELYCGNGNFSLALADQFNRVVATEISKTSVKAALDGKAMNNIENVDFARVSAEEFTAHMKGIKARRRLKDMRLESANFGTVLVDPPRAGLDEDSCKLISEYERIVYISCNPETLANNLAVLGKTHNIERFAMFDQFPYTHHIECGAYLVKR